VPSDASSEESYGNVSVSQRIVGALIAMFGPLAAQASWAVERFPPPDFIDHVFPETTTPPPLSMAYEWSDVAMLAIGLAAAAYFALVRRSRLGLYALSIVSLAWLGFWRRGCICPIGATQNVALALADPNYAIPLSVLVVFALPILATLFFGRTFCASVCPLGAVQELSAMLPVRVPRWLDQSLGVIPYVYLGAAVLFAATGTTFVICNYDPFVGIFRMSASRPMIVLAVCFLVVGVFIGRPYCRYLCPYGAILGVCAKLAKTHLRIPPGECIQCKLCEDACPYGAIVAPTVDPTPAVRAGGRRRLAALLAAFPVLAAGGWLLGRSMALPMSRVHPTAALAEQVRLEETDPWAPPTDSSDAFRNTGRASKDLYEEAMALHDTFKIGGAWFGAFVGCVIGAKLIHVTIRRRRTEYQPDRAGCVSCGRCFWYCPVEQQRLGLIAALPEAASGSGAGGAAPGSSESSSARVVSPPFSG
jgi:NosR/NirI family nitrous oxide reductase transcriptional regulator